MEPLRSVPAAMGSVKNTGRPKMQSSSANGDSRIVHREYLTDVTMATVFTATTYPINPGYSTTFPWLSQVAQRYESYRFSALRFCFETATSSTETGTVMLVPDYDSLDSAPVNKTQALAYRSSARAQPWLSFCQSSLKEDISKRQSYYVRTGSIPANADSRLYDVGNMFLCVQGSSTNVVGELWVEYDVTLMTPQIEGSALSGRVTSGGGGVTAATIFGNTPVITGTVDISVAGNTIKFNQAFQGLLYIRVHGVGLTGLTISGTAELILPPAVVLINGAADTMNLGQTFRADPGETVILNATTSTSITIANVRIGNYSYSLQ